MQERPWVREIERVVGKLGYCESVALHARAVQEAVFGWLVGLRARRARRALAPGGVVGAAAGR
eukprot:8939561-Lingulodinium_polyedra.AAC.1